MNPEMYTIAALAARYLFAALMAIIVGIAFGITKTDAKRARVLHDMLEDERSIGALFGDGKRYFLPIQGIIGSSRRADVVIHGKGIRRFHARFEWMKGGMLIEPLGKAEVAIGKQRVTGERFFARSGDEIHLGGSKFLLQLPKETPDPFMEES